MKNILRFLYAMVLAAGLSGMHLIAGGGPAATGPALPDQIDFVGLAARDVFNYEIARVEKISVGMRKVGDLFVPPQLEIDTNVVTASRNVDGVRSLIKRALDAYPARIRGFVGDTAEFEIVIYGDRTFPDGVVFGRLVRKQSFHLDFSSGSPMIPKDAYDSLLKVDETMIKCIVSKIPGIKRFSLYKTKAEDPGFERDLRFDSSYNPPTVEILSDIGYVCIPMIPDLIARLSDKNSKEFVTLWGEPTQPKRYRVSDGKAVPPLPIKSQVFPVTNEGDSSPSWTYLFVRAEPESYVTVKVSTDLKTWSTVEEGRKVSASAATDFELEYVGDSAFYSIEPTP